MRILKVWDSEYPWDVRTEKVCRALTEMGHEVHMVARNRDRRILREERAECTIHRMRPFRLLGGTVDRASQFPAFFNPRWLSLMLRTARDQDAEAVLVRDLPLAPTAIKAARRLGVPAYLDMAENYPAMIRDLWTTGSTKPGDSIIRNPKLVEMVERKVLREIDHIFVVVEESRDRLLDLGVPEEKVSVVSNTPSLDRLESYAAIADETANDPSKRRGAQDARGHPLRLVYLGLMEEARGVGLALEAVALARRDGLDVRLDLIGDGRSLTSFREKTHALDLGEDTVRFHGFVPYEDALRRVAAADVGLIPHFANESWETTIPNKLFDYMSLGLPVLASSVSPVERVLAETNAGRVFADRDARDMARVLCSLSDRTRLREMGRAGRDAIRSRYNWERDAARLKYVFPPARD